MRSRVGRIMLAALLAVSMTGGAAARWTLAKSAPLPTLSRFGDDAVTAIVRHWYAGGAQFRVCPDCTRSVDSDWGADSLIDVLYERWLLTGDRRIAEIFKAIVAHQPWDALGSFSDVAMWDAVAAIRAYDVTHDPRALARAERNYFALAASQEFSRGPCGSIDYQIRGGGGRGLKTLETDSNRILAAVLISQRATQPSVRRRTLADAKALYAAVRATFLDPRLPLYTVYVFAARERCVQVPGQFFASVNGRMIEAGVALASATGDERYARDAQATAKGIGLLADDRGIFVDQQAQNDVVAPLVLGVLELARRGDGWAKEWIVRNALAAASSRDSNGSYSRFFDGPPPPRQGTVSIFDGNGGFALIVAAGALAPSRRPRSNGWEHAMKRVVSLTAAPRRYRFTGSGIAFVGPLPRKGSPLCHPLTVGECEGGRVAIRIDGRKPTEQVGIWQGKVLVPSDASILFAWRWPREGMHEIDFDPVRSNAKQGGTAMAIRQAILLP